MDINNEEEAAKLLEGMQFDAVADFIAFRKEQLERDYRLFGGRTRQFIYISSASAYQKPATDYLITESTPLCNPYWQYSRDKTEGGGLSDEALQRGKLPHHYCKGQAIPLTNVPVPLGVHGENGSWQVLKKECWKVSLLSSMVTGPPVDHDP